MLAVGGAILALIVVALLVRHGRPGTDRTNGAVSPLADSMPAPAAPAPAAREHQRPAPGVVAAPDQRSGSVPTSAGPGSRRYAQTWVKVRGNRTRSAPTVGTLNPGDAVTVDSLVRGWYRVLVDGRTLGYVRRSTLDVSRPE
jgi:Bacterial SH3 domain